MIPLRISSAIRVSSGNRWHNSVSASEVAKFSRIGNSWWDSNSREGTGPLHLMNPVRVAFIRDAVASQMGRSKLPVFAKLHGLRILDVGCGGGLLAESLARLGAKVTAIDPSPQNIDVARNHSKMDPRTATIDYRNMTVDCLAESEDRFDVVCSLEVLEHVPDKAKFISDCVKCIDKDGSLFISTMNRTAKSFTIAIAGAEYVIKALPPGTHDWNHFIKPEELRYMIQSSLPKDNEQQISVIDMQGIVMDLNKTLSMDFKLSPNDLDVNYIVHAVKSKR